MRNSRFFAQLADTCRQEGDLDRAVELLTKGLERNPDYITARIILARCYTDRGDLHQAVEEYDRILDLDPFHASALKEKIKVLLRTGNVDAARRCAEMYLDEVPNDEEITSMIRETGPTPTASGQPPAAVEESREEEVAAGELPGEEERAELPVEETPAGEAEPETPEEKTPVEEGERVQADDEELIEEKPVEVAGEEEIGEEEVPVKRPDEEAPVEHTGAGEISGESEGVDAGAGPSEAAPEHAAGEKTPIDSENELIATMTLAEIYAAQGFYDKAIEIYQRIISREPENETARVRIGELQRRDVGAMTEEERSREDFRGGGTVDRHGVGTAGEIVTDEEYQKFRKWLRSLTQKREQTDTSGNGEEQEIGDDS